MRWLTSRVALGLSCGLLLAASARADWPTQRHDPKRTGLATGSSDVVKPAVYFRYYLGGSLSSAALLAHDVDGDGTPELVHLSGGSVVAKRSNDDIVWKTAPGGYQQLLSIGDLNGDKQDDIVVHTQGGVVILHASTGQVQWRQPAGQMGTLGRAVVGDLDGDGLDDLVTQECACCGAVSGNAGYVFSFANGFASATSLWDLPHAACSGYRSLTLVDIDGTPPLEVINSDENALYLLDGATGTTLASSPPLGSWTQGYSCRGHDVDGAPGDEILCVLNRSTQPAIDQRKVTVLKRNGNSLDVLWSNIVAPDDGGDLSYVDPFVDLNGDGVIEVAIASKDAQDLWTTRIFDAKTGTEITNLSGEQLVGIAPVEEVGKSLVLTFHGGVLSAYAFEGATLVLRWKLNDRRPVTEWIPKQSRSSSLHHRTVTVDLDEDGIDELITRSASGGQKVTAYKTSGQSPQQLAVYALPVDVGALNLWKLPPIDTGSNQLGVAQNDGRLMLLDSQLVPTPLGLSDPGIRIGGYYAAGTWGDLQRTPVAAVLDGGLQQAIVVPDSRGALLRLDAASASLASPPTRAWQRPKTRAASIISTLDSGSPGIVSFAQQQPATSPPSYRVVSLRPDGTLLFDVPLEGLPLRDIMPGDINQDGTPDLLFHWGEPENTLLQTRAIDGITGSTLWNATPTEPNCGRQPAGLTVSDFTGDGRVDVLHHAASQTHVLDGQDGSVVLSGLYVGGCYAMVSAYDTDGDQKPEHILHGSNYGPTALENDLKTLRFTTAPGGQHFPYGAIAPCSKGPVLVVGSWARRSELSIIPIAGSSAGQAATMALAGGKAYGSEAAAAMAGSFLGQLTTASAHANLTGKGRPTVVVGSSDGWLYAVDPCALSIDFAMNFNTAVGETIFADTDGDGRDELVFTAADGYLYGVKHAAIAAPQTVLDTDPDAGLNDGDIDSRPNTGRLSASWQAVDGAMAYHVAIVDGLGQFLTDPAWIDVGQATEHTVSELPLEDNHFYTFAVRAIHVSGDPSIDTLSDGVTVYGDYTPTTTGGGGSGGAGGGGSDGGAKPGPNTRHVLIDNGCGCQLPGTPGGSQRGLLFALIGAWGVLFGRRRNRALTNDERRDLGKRKRRRHSSQ